jgi:hypothetical protein
MRLLLVLVLFARPLRRSDRRVSLAVTVDDLNLDFVLGVSLAHQTAPS